MVLQIVAQTYINFKYQKEEEKAGPQLGKPAVNSDCKSKVIVNASELRAGNCVYLTTTLALH
jgi:hypothetical protein